MRAILPPVTSTPCPDEGELRDYVANRIGPTRAAVVRQHARGCTRCAVRLGLHPEPQGTGEELSTLGMDPLQEPLPAPLSRGANVGRYLVLEALGRGGMGVIYAGYDPELHRRVALKLLQVFRTAPADGPAAQQRLLREAQALARLSHPNVIAVFDVGTYGDRVFIAMELVEGRSLRALMRTPTPWREAVRLFRQAGEGLSAAHKAGLVHRDFKPDNVLVGGDGRVRVMDFGLARQTAPAGEQEVDTGELPFVASPPTQAEDALGTPLTQAGVVIGTPPYMAPEQLVLKVSDPRSDQFSFCVSLYEMLYGERPFPPQPQPTLNPADWPVRPPPPYAKVPAKLRKLLLRGLSVDPAQRFPSMEALLAQLQADPAVPRRRAVAALGALAFTAAVAAGVGQTAGRRQALCRGGGARMAGVWDEDRRGAVKAAFAGGESAFQTVSAVLDRYAQAWVAQYQETCEATRIRGEQSDEVLGLRMECLDRRLSELGALTHLFASADEALVGQSGKAAHALTPLETCRQVQALRETVRLPEEPFRREQVKGLREQLARAKALADGARYADALALAKALAPQARELRFRPVEGELLELMGEIHDKRAEVKEAARALEDAAFAAEAGHDDTLKALAAARRVRVAMLEDEPAVAESWANLARATLERLGGNAIIESYVESALGGLAFKAGRYDEALARFRKALALREKGLGPMHPDVAGAHNNVANALVRSARFSEARAEAMAALEITETSLGPEHVDVTGPLHLLSVLSAELGLPEDQERFARRGLAITEKVLGREHVETFRALEELGDALLDRGKSSEGLPMLDRALALLRKADGERSRRFVRLSTKLCDVWAQFGREEEGLRVIQALVAAHEKDASAPAVDALDYAGVLLANRRYREAEQQALAALREREARQGMDHPDRASALLMLAWVQVEQHRPLDALKALFESLRIREVAFGKESLRLTEVLTGITRAHLALHQPELAKATAERAAALAAKAKGSVRYYEAELAYAEALWAAGERGPEPLERAKAARAFYLAAGRKGALADADAFLEGKAPVDTLGDAAVR